MVGGTKTPGWSVWVTVDNVQQPRTLWSYRLSEDGPVTPIHGTTDARGILSDKLCYSYLELFDWLCLYGLTPPPPDYFAPTPEELAEGFEWIVRRVPRPR